MVDGFYGPKTERAVMDCGPAYIQEMRAAESIRNRHVAHDLSKFRGDLGFLHELEHHHGLPYWPGGESGITLDPGYDLGHAWVRNLLLYVPYLTKEQIDALHGVVGLQGEAAGQTLEASTTIQSIRISRQQAESYLPKIAAPYWDQAAKRWPTITEEKTPESVQMAILSLVYNRGANNPRLSILDASLNACVWLGAAFIIFRMQQAHDLLGVRLRRMYEASIIFEDLWDNTD